MHLQLQKWLQVFKNIYKYVQLIKNFKQQINPLMHKFTKKKLCAIYEYHMNGPLNFNLSGNGTTWRKVLYI